MPDKSMNNEVTQRWLAKYLGIAQALELSLDNVL